MKTRSERLRHHRSWPLEFLEARNLLSPAPFAPTAEVRQEEITVPFRLEFEGTRTVTDRVDLSADGEATQWGRFHLEEHHHLVLTRIPGTTLFSVNAIDGLATFTTSAGVVISAHYSGTGIFDLAHPESVEINFHYEIDGDSGLHKGDMREFAVDLVISGNTLDPSPQPVTATGVGSITFVAPPDRP